MRNIARALGLNFAMRFRIEVLVGFLGVLGVTLAGCTPVGPVTVVRQSSKSACTPASDTQCFFRNSPIRLVETPVHIPGRDLVFFPLAADLEFVDLSQETWLAPKGTLTDGASIPTVLIPVVGDPRDPKVVNAAAMHDAYCGIGNEAGPKYRTKTWQATHRLFYDALIAGGTPEIKAKIMYAAVWMGGPRWNAKTRQSDQTMQRLPATLLENAMRETRFYIDRSNPTLSDLDTYLEWKQGEMERLAYRTKGP